VLVGVGAALLLTVVGAVVVAGAGGDDGGGPTTTELTRREQFVRHISAYVYAIGGAGTINQDQADCVAQRMVDQVGIDQLEELDILNTLDRSQPLVVGSDAQATYREAFDCLDDQTLVAFLAGTIQLAPEVEIGPDQADCMVQGWLARIGRDALVDMYAVLSTEGVTSEVLQGLPAEQGDVLIDVAAGCAGPAPTTPPP